MPCKRVALFGLGMVRIRFFCPDKYFKPMTTPAPSLLTITIPQLLEHNVGTARFYRDRIVVTDRVENMQRFKSPCRIDAIVVLVCRGGEADISANLNHYHLQPDTIWVNFPDDILQIHDAQDLDAYAVLISSPYLDELGLDFKWRSDFYLSIRDNALCSVPHSELLTLRPYYPLLIRNMDTPCTETAEVMRGLVRAFSYTVVSLMHGYGRPGEELTDKVKLRNKQLFGKFMTLVKQHHICARGVKYYADKLCLTPNYLSGAVKDYTGKTVTEWVNEYVTLEAKVMLRNSDCSVSEIAYKLNFSSPSAFGKYFKAQAGIGPRAYRKGTAGRQKP